MVYAYACLSMVCVRERRPNLTVDIPAIQERAREKRMPVAGKDLRPARRSSAVLMFKARMLGVAGWYSTNILGNRDGEVLDDPESFDGKAAGARAHPAAGDVPGTVWQDVSQGAHQLLPPRRQQEGWDNIDIFGWLAIRCSQGRLPAAIRSGRPIVLDLALFMDGPAVPARGTQRLSFY